MNPGKIFALPHIRARLQAHVPRFIDSPEVTRRAAVAAILRDGVRGPEVLLMRRAEKLGDPWSGHISFPGGHMETVDADLHATAIRETHEEMGFDLNVHGELIGRLDDVPAYTRNMPTGMLVSPHVFALRSEPTLQTNHEVVGVLWAPLSEMFTGALTDARMIDVRGTPMRFEGYRIDDHWVWGLTFMMIQALFTVVDPDFQRWTGPEGLGESEAP
jgi:8-oxo-dGTP pyrophosphatase MutT (NUDIX family)